MGTGLTASGSGEPWWTVKPAGSANCQFASSFFTLARFMLEKEKEI